MEDQVSKFIVEAITKSLNTRLEGLKSALEQSQNITKYRLKRKKVAYGLEWLIQTCISDHFLYYRNDLNIEDILIGEQHPNSCKYDILLKRKSQENEIITIEIKTMYGNNFAVINDDVNKKSFLNEKRFLVLVGYPYSRSKDHNVLGVKLISNTLLPYNFRLYIFEKTDSGHNKRMNSD